MSREHLIVHERSTHYVLRSTRHEGWLDLCELAPSGTHGVVVGRFGPGYEQRAIEECDRRADEAERRR